MVFIPVGIRKSVKSKGEPLDSYSKRLVWTEFIELRLRMGGRILEEFGSSPLPLISTLIFFGLKLVYRGD